MRSDINILWIEDSPDWQRKAEELFLLKTEDYGLLTNIKYISEGMLELFKQIKNEADGYKVYDIIFVDYNISGENAENDEEKNITGDKIIEEFRKYDIDADILFYSQDLTEDAKKELIFNSPVAFDGIYLANRKDFQEHALKLYKKNIRKLTSMLNIRGLLTDKTSENDYVMNSYLLKKYECLSAEQKKVISEKVNSLLKEKLELVQSKSKKAEKLSESEIHSIKQIYDLPDFLFSITNRYEIFSEILALNNNTTFVEHSITEYQDKIIKMRNNVAHKKIDICKQQKYLKYYDTLKQYLERSCPEDCNSHTDEFKISLEVWQDTLKLANEYSKLFDKILSGLIEEEMHSGATK